jgi:hypothetical protein
MAREEFAPDYIAGAFQSIDLSAVEEMTSGNGPKIPPGVYEFTVKGQRMKGENRTLIDMEIVQGPDDQHNADGWTIPLGFGTSLEAGGFYKGFIGLAAPWHLWEQFLPPVDPETGGVHAWVEWFLGARVRAEVIQEEVPTTDKKTGEKVNKLRSNIVPGTMELLEPAPFAAKVLAYCGIDPSLTEAPAGFTSQQALYVAKGQEVPMLVKIGLGKVTKGNAGAKGQVTVQKRAVQPAE